MGPGGLRGRRSPELTPGTAHTERPAPSTARRPASRTPPALGSACTTPPPPPTPGAKAPSAFLPCPWPAPHRRAPSPSQGRQPRLRAHPPSGIDTPPGNPTAPSLPITPQPGPVWSLDHALRFPHDLSTLKPLTPKNGISVLSPNLQYGHWPQIPPLPGPKALPGVKAPRRPPRASAAVPARSAHSGALCLRAERTAGL